MVATKTTSGIRHVLRLNIHIEEATLPPVASVPVVEWLATFNQIRKIEQVKGERSCPLFSGNPPPVI